MPNAVAKQWVAVVVAGALALGGRTALGADPNKVLRLAIYDIETLDPQQFNDSPSSDVVAAIFEGLYECDYLATPAKLAPVCAIGLPRSPTAAKRGRCFCNTGFFSPTIRPSRASRAN